METSWVPLAASDHESYIILLAKRAATTRAAAESKAAEDRERAKADRIPSMEDGLAQILPRTAR